MKRRGLAQEVVWMLRGGREAELKRLKEHAERDRAVGRREKRGGKAERRRRVGLPELLTPQERRQRR